MYSNVHYKKLDSLDFPMACIRLVINFFYSKGLPKIAVSAAVLTAHL